MTRGILVVFEGGEGAGKSTQVAALAESLRTAGEDVLVTREPGGTEVAEEVRGVLLAQRPRPMAERAEVLLFAAARADHVHQVISPALARGQIVVCDRFVDSSIAYQGYARGIDIDEVTRISAWATDGLRPDLTVLLDVAPEIGLARAQDGNRMEAEPPAFHAQVRAGLRALAAADPDRYLVLDATAASADIAETVLAATRTTLAGER